MALAQALIAHSLMPHALITQACFNAYSRFR